MSRAAFPAFRSDPWGRQVIDQGLSDLDYFAAHAPITLDDVYQLFAAQAPKDKPTILTFDNALQQLAVLRWRYARTMLATRPTDAPQAVQS